MLRWVEASTSLNSLRCEDKLRKLDLEENGECQGGQLVGKIHCDSDGHLSVTSQVKCSCVCVLYVPCDARTCYADSLTKSVVAEKIVLRCNAIGY